LRGPAAVRGVAGVISTDGLLFWSFISWCSVLNDNGRMSPAALDQETHRFAVAKLVALGILPDGYDQTLTFNRLRALRFDFLVKRRLAKEDSLRQRLQEAADLCGRLLAHLEDGPDAPGNLLTRPEI
jgi:hypothetical protein